MRPTGHLQVFVVPTGPGDPDDLVRAWLTSGHLAPDGVPGALASGLVDGGFERWRVDRRGGAALWANRQGGFTVRCPDTDEPVVRAFVAEWERHRGSAGPLPELACPACGGRHPLDALTFRPPARFAPWALALVRAASAEVQLPPAPFGLSVVRSRG